MSITQQSAGCLLAFSVALVVPAYGQQGETVLPAPHAAAAPTPGRPALAVLEFQYGAVREQQAAMRGSIFRRAAPPVIIDSTDVGRGIADLLVEQLVGGGEFRVIERTRLADVAQEREGGDKTRAQYLVMGTVTQFGGEEKTRAGSAIASGVASLFSRGRVAGGVRLKATYAYVGISCRVVDTATGEIVASVSGQGQSQRRGTLLGGLASGSRVLGGSLSVDSADFRSTILGEATIYAVKDAADKIRLALNRSGATDGIQASHSMARSDRTR